MTIPDWGDDAATFARMLTDTPEASDKELIRQYRKYEAKTCKLLDRPEVWGSVERLAARLLRTGKVAAEEAWDVMDERVRRRRDPAMRRALRLNSQWAKVRP